MNTQRPRLETAAVIVLILLLGYAIADIGILSFRDKLLPSEPPVVRPPMRIAQTFVGREKFQNMLSRNIFSRDGKIPDPIGGQPTKQEDGQPVPTQLPIALVGTLVHANPVRSVATLNLKNKNEVVAIRVDGEIPDGQGTVTKIERNKMIFRNSASGRLEYVDMKEEGAAIGFNVTTATMAAPGITVNSENDRSVKREDLNRHLQNLPQILQEARAVPRIGPNGQVECFNIAEMKAGSILEALGIRRGDCIETVNGERIDSPAKAMEVFQQLRGSATQINLGFERGGRKENSNYSIME